MSADKIGLLSQEDRPSTGIQRLPQVGIPGYGQPFAEIAGDWLRQWPKLPAVARGMVGSAQGWKEAP